MDYLRKFHSMAYIPRTMKLETAKIETFNGEGTASRIGNGHAWRIELPWVSYNWYCGGHGKREVISEMRRSETIEMDNKSQETLRSIKHRKYKHAAQAKKREEKKARLVELAEIEKRGELAEKEEKEKSRIEFSMRQTAKRIAMKAANDELQAEKRALAKLANGNSDSL